MCGISGIFNFNGAPVDPGLLYAMADRMKQRGPDGEGYYTDGPCGLAHRRLAIIDPAGGAQPLFNEDKSIVFVHNGEIYNHHELRKELEAKGHQFRTRSDSECIGHLYEEYGSAFPEKLEGMFAIALFDRKKEKLILATDRAGKKPIFYFQSAQGFRFASSLAALRVNPDMPGDFDLQAIWDYLSYLCIPAPDTLYLGVSRMLPACVMEISPKMEYPDARIYWKPDYARKTKLSFTQSADNIRQVLTKAVADRLEADVPLGMFLSGGLDSTIIAAIVSQIPDSKPLDCFSIGVNDPVFDESAMAKQNAEFLQVHAKRKLQFHQKIIQPDDFTLLEKLCVEYGQPFADPSILPTRLLCEFAKESVTVALSGDGADELFAGYERYRALNLYSAIERIPGSFLKAGSQMVSLLNRAAGERSFFGRLQRFLKVASIDPDFQYHELLSKCSFLEKKELMGEAFPDFVPQKSNRLWRELKHHSTASGPVEHAMEFDYHFYLPNDILVKMDTASMSASLEVRSPFLDRRVVEAAASLPLSMKLNGKQRKFILGHAFRDLLPPELANARKRGFGIPVSSWLAGPWKEHLTQNLLEGCAINKYHLFRKQTVEKRIAEHCGKRADHGYLLYMLLVLELTLSKENS